MLCRPRTRRCPTVLTAAALDILVALAFVHGRDGYRQFAATTPVTTFNCRIVCATAVSWAHECERSRMRSRASSG
jgi:hypothetical protein